MARVAAALLLATLLAAPPAALAAGAWFNDVSFAYYRFSFVGGQSGPWTPVSDTTYRDTFADANGVRAELAHDAAAAPWGFLLGYSHQVHAGKHFAGGEFPNGVDFSELLLDSVYLGARARWPDALGSFSPYLVMTLGLTRIGPVSITDNGTTRAYWKKTDKDRGTLGGGFDYALSKDISFTCDLRLDLFGEPKAEFTQADATGGNGFALAVGLRYRALRD